MSNSKLINLLDKIRNRESNRFDNFILIVITFSSILIGIETNHELALKYHRLFQIFDTIVLAIFVFEVFFKWYAFAPKPWKYFYDSWNIFDFLIVAISVLPIVLQSSVNTEAVIVLRVLRLARVFRVFRFISVLKPLKILVDTLIKSLPSMGYVALLILILFYVYGVIGVFMFYESDPTHYGTLMASLLTLFQTITGEGWPDLLSTQKEIGNTLIASIYYISFIVVGSMIILNLFIGVIVSELENLREIDAKGKEKIDDEEHILILGWSSKMKHLIDELIEANEDSKHTFIAILADKTKHEMEDYFKHYFKDKLRTHRNIHFIYRSGIPFENVDLKMMNIDKAKSVIIQGHDDQLDDIYVLKILMTILGYIHDHNNMPHISLPLKDKKNDDIVKIIGNNNINTVLVKDITARIIAQTCRQFGLSIIYDELFSFDGHEIHTKKVEDLKELIIGSQFADLINSFEHASLIGIVQNETGEVIINPRADYTIKSGDSLIAIAEKSSTFEYKINNHQRFSVEQIKQNTQQRKVQENYLIIGANNNLIEILNQINSYVGKGSKLQIVSDFDIFDPAKIKFRKELSNLLLEYKDTDTSSKEELFDLEYEKFDSIIILGYIDSLSKVDADSNAIITLMYIRDILKEKRLDKSIVTEILSNKNEKILNDNEYDDFIISDKIDSLFLAQYTQNPYIKQIYDCLLSEKGSEIYLKPATDYIELGKIYSGYDLNQICYEKGDIFIGYQIHDLINETRLKYGIEINPEKNSKVKFENNDRIIVVSEVQYVEEIS